MREFVSDQRVTEYVCQRTGIRLGQDHSCLGIVRDGVVLGGVVFTHFSGTDVSITVAVSSPRVFTKQFLIRVGQYIFSELRVSRVTILTEQPAVVEFALRRGAKIEGIKRDAFGPGRNATMLGLLASEWPFREAKRLRPVSSRSDMHGIRPRRPNA